MPRFHFNVYDGISFPDPRGVELAGWQEARLEAVRYLGEILQHDTKRLALGRDWHMEVTDAVGLVLFRLDFAVMETAATMGKDPVAQ